MGERLTTGTPTPVPLSATVCAVAVLEALSAMLSEAGAAPTAVGLKVTEIAQEALAASDVPQVLVCEYDPALAPPKVTLEIVSAPVPVFLSVTDCAADVEPTLVEAKVRLVGERLTAGTPTPVPLSETVCAAPDALSEMLSEAEAAPIAAGWKATETVQVALTASEVPQLLD